MYCLIDQHVRILLLLLLLLLCDTWGYGYNDRTGANDGSPGDWYGMNMEEGHC